MAKNIITNLNARQKKWISVITMLFIAVGNITWPYDIKQHLPAWLFGPLLGTVTLLNIVAILLLVCAWRVYHKETD